MAYGMPDRQQSPVRMEFLQDMQYNYMYIYSNGTNKIWNQKTGLLPPPSSNYHLHPSTLSLRCFDMEVDASQAPPSWEMPAQDFEVVRCGELNLAAKQVESRENHKIISSLAEAGIYIYNYPFSGEC